MTNSSRKRIERLLRHARQNIFDKPEYCFVIQKCKQLLMPTWAREAQDRANKRMINYFM